MTKSLMISIRPEHAVNIINGYKTLELRKWIPKGYVGWVYAYVTKGKPYLIKITSAQWLKDNVISYTLSNKTLFFEDVLNGKVVARFWFDEYDKYVDVSNCGMTSCGFECDYDFRYGLYNLDDELKKLCLTYDEVENYGKGKDLYAWHIKKLEVFDEPKELSEFYTKDISECINDMEVCQQVYGLKKAPQKFCYCYVVKG